MDPLCQIFKSKIGPRTERVKNHIWHSRDSQIPFESKLVGQIKILFDVTVRLTFKLFCNTLKSMQSLKEQEVRRPP